MATSVSELDTSAFGFEVEISAIPARLKELWVSNDTAARASLINLAIYSEEVESIHRNTLVVADITREHACRVILIAAPNPTGKPSTRAWVTAHCHLNDAGKKAVCCEQVSFVLEGLSTHRLSNIIFANLDSDLPLVLWWQGSLTERFEECIYSRVDRLILDSNEWVNPKEEFEALLNASSRRTSSFIVHDLNWTRTFHLRLNVASCFDEPAALKHLATLSTIDIVFGEGFELTAILFVAWIGTRLGYLKGRPTEGGCELMTRDGTTLRVALNKCNEGPSIGALVFHTKEVSFSFTHQAESRFCHVKSSLHDRVEEQVFPADRADQAGLLKSQLGRGGYNGPFFKVVRLAKELLQ